MVQLAARSGCAEPAAELPGQAVRDAPPEHHGQGTLRAEPRTTSSSAFAQWGQKQQPNRLDTFLVGATAAIHNSADSTWNQSYWAHTYKVGWDSVVSDKMFFEIHGGQFHYLWPNTRNTNAPAYQDLTTNIVSGGNQDGWFRDITRNQVLGSLSYFKDGWAGSHNFKFGGEFFNERYDDLRGQDGLGQVPGDVLMVLRNGVAVGSRAVPVAIRVAERSVDDRAVRVGHLASEPALDDDARRSCSTGTDRTCRSRQVRPSVRSIATQTNFAGRRQPDHVEHAGAARSASPTT